MTFELKSMRRLVGLALVFLTVVHLNATEVVREYEQFKDHGIFDPEVSAEKVNQMLIEGLSHDNPEVTRLSLLALQQYTSIMINGLPAPIEPLPIRRVQDVPQVKNYLLEHFREMHAKSGYDTEQVWHSSVEKVDKLFEGRADLEVPLDVVDAEALQKYADMIVDNTPLWPGFTQILCSWWPRDPDVHEHMWERLQNEPTIQPYQTLSLLNLGKFSTPEANRYREEQLELALKERQDEPIFDQELLVIAQGFRLSQPPGVIQPLMEAAAISHAAKDDILITLATYDDEQLQPHISDLSKLVNVPRHTLRSDEQMQSALDRLQPLVDSM